MPLLSSDRSKINQTGINVITALIGLCLLGFFVHRAGINSITQNIFQLGWAFLIVVALGGLRFLVRAAAWIRCFEGNHSLSLSNVFQAMIVGDTLGNLTPFSLIISEPTKTIFLSKQEPISRTLPALAVENFLYTVSALLVIITGLLSFFFMFQLPERLWLSSTIILCALVSVVSLIHWLIWNQIHIVHTTMEWLRKHGVARHLISRFGVQLKEIEKTIHSLYPRTWSRLLPVAILELFFHVLAIIEIFLILYVISDQTPTLLDAFVLESTNRFIAVVFKFVPMRIGIDEAGTGLLAEFLDFGTSVGVTLALIRKGRMLVWMCVGIVSLVRRGLPLNQSLNTNPQSIALAIMARSPIGSPAPKTRLADAIKDTSDRRRLYTAFLKDTVAGCRTITGTSLRLAHTDSASNEWFSSVNVEPHEALPQRGKQLGERQRNVFRDLFVEGFKAVILVGSDIPTLPRSYLSKAAEKLQKDTVVLGPCSDGGYYLIALSSPEPEENIPDLFSDIRWSTEFALEDTKAAATRAGYQVTLLPEWYDVDDAKGLQKLQREFNDDSKITAAYETKNMLEQILRNQNS